MTVSHGRGLCRGSLATPLADACGLARLRKRDPALPEAIDGPGRKAGYPEETLKKKQGVFRYVIS